MENERLYISDDCSSSHLSKVCVLSRNTHINTIGIKNSWDGKSNEELALITVMFELFGCPFCVPVCDVSEAPLAR